MENVSEDPFSSFLKNVIRYRALAQARRLDPPSQPIYSFDMEQSDFSDLPFKMEEPNFFNDEGFKSEPPLMPGPVQGLAENFTGVEAASENTPAIIPLYTGFPSMPPATSEAEEPAKRGKRTTCTRPPKPFLKPKRPSPCKEGKYKNSGWKDDDSSSESLSRGDTDKKKKRLERNRKSARESRRRKKEYIHCLENQVIL